MRFIERFSDTLMAFVSFVSSNLLQKDAWMANSILLSCFSDASVIGFLEPSPRNITLSRWWCAREPEWASQGELGSFLLAYFLIFKDI